MTESVPGLRGYARVLTHGPAVRPFVAAVIGRMPVGMNGLGMVMVVQQVTGLYAVAGVVTGAFALATAVGAPVWGRLMDRHGQPRVLAPTAWVSGIAVACVALAAVGGAPPAALVALAVVAGLFFPPLSPAMRAAWRVIYCDEESRRFGYALDASAVELIFVLGPLLLSLLATWSAPQTPLLVSAALLVVGTTLYSRTDAARASSRIAVTLERRTPSRPAILEPGIAAVLVVSALMAVGFGQLDTGMVAAAGQVLGATTMLGVLFGFLAGGSAIGGIAYGARSWPGSDRGRLLVLLSTFAATLMPWPFLLRTDHPPMPVLFALLFVTGLTIAPSLILFQQLLDEMAPPDQMNEVQGLLSASQTTGAAGGMAVAGFTVDAWGAPGGVAGAAVAVAASALVAGLVRVRWRRAQSARVSVPVA